MSIEDNDIDALLDGAKLDAEDGPAPRLDRPALDREVGNLFARRDAVLRAQRRRWLVSAAVGGVLASFNTSILAQCQKGLCEIECAQGSGDCDGNPANGCEVNLLVNGGNCGACGHACDIGAGQPCISGTSLTVDCPEGTVQ